MECEIENSKENLSQWFEKYCELQQLNNLLNNCGFDNLLT